MENLRTTDTIKFTNSSTNATSYNWDFGDGSTSTDKEPTHVYRSLGTYKITLTSKNDGLVDTISKIITLSDVIAIKNTNSIDVDGDNIDDLWFYAGSFGGNTMYMRSGVRPSSDYSIITDSVIVDGYESTNNPQNYKVLRYIPKSYSIGDTIKSSEKLTLQSLDFAYSNFTHSGQELNNKWISEKIQYIGFCKTKDGKTKIGWVKLKVTDFAALTLISFKVPTEGIRLIIK